MDAAQLVIATFGTAGVVMTQFQATERHACLAGLVGQFGWASALSWATQPGMCVVSVVCCAAWIFGFWRHWIRSWLSTATTVTAAPTFGQGSPMGQGAATTRPKLRLVKKPVQY